MDEVARNRQISFQMRTQRWFWIEQSLPVFEGAFGVLRRAGNMRQRAVERNAYNTLYGWIVEATTQLAMSISLGRVTRHEADAWNDMLNLYDGRLSEIRLNDFDEDLADPGPSGT